MSDVRRLSNFISRTVSGPMWHGPALSEQLVDVTAFNAASKPIPNAHSIWEIVLHMTFWAEMAHSRLGAAQIPDPTPGQDWPEVTTHSNAEWREAVNRLYTAYRVLAEDAAEMELAQLQRILPGRDHSAQEMLHGLIEHGAYHAGQIAILKRAITHVGATRPTAELEE
jgi:uncharacterized damage-inducible protein DinB